VWAQRAGGPGDDVATGVAVSGASVYVAGRFASVRGRFGGRGAPARLSSGPSAPGAPATTWPRAWP
ncbi:hypothetical protein, partial [Hymenobacter coccineus]|uniref:hypothetical protein n=1 Tax=Hymenobacter coccineus TaxID=1908235 RepID=UPI0019558117